MARHEFLIYWQEKDTPASVTWEDGEVSTSDPSGAFRSYLRQVELLMAKPPPKRLSGRLTARNGPPYTMAWGGEPQTSVRDFLSVLSAVDPTIKVIQPEGLDVDIDLTYHGKDGVVY